MTRKVGHEIQSNTIVFFRKFSGTAVIITKYITSTGQ